MTVFRHLLVPLDGSQLAEAALPVAATLARRLGACVTLLHVVERGAPGTVHGEPHLTRPAEAEAYLGQVAQWLAGQSLRADFLVHLNGDDVGGCIAGRAVDIQADLIVLCTHGRSRFRALLFGRVAQQALIQGTTPVLLVPPTGMGRQQPFGCSRLLVPLDGSETAETALPAAAAVARACGAEALLMWVVPTVETVSGEWAVATRLMPTATAALLDAEADQATTYLQRVAARLHDEGVAAAAMVARGEPVRMVRDAVAKQAIDLVVMATHGRAGAAAVWEGSVAVRLAAQAACPMLLVRIPAPPG